MLRFLLCLLLAFVVLGLRDAIRHRRNNPRPTPGQRVDAALRGLHLTGHPGPSLDQLADEHAAGPVCPWCGHPPAVGTADDATPAQCCADHGRGICETIAAATSYTDSTTPPQRSADYAGPLAQRSHQLARWWQSALIPGVRLAVCTCSETVPAADILDFWAKHVVPLGPADPPAFITVRQVVDRFGMDTAAEFLGMGRDRVARIICPSAGALAATP